MNSEVITVFRLIFVTLLPVLFTIGIVLFDKSKYSSKLSYWTKQIIVGIIFGSLAILGTEAGINVNGAVVNARDGAVLTAGLLFGGPAGVIAGLLGGIERWFSVYWGVGSFTRIACSLSTALGGFYCIFINKYLMEYRKPRWFLTLIAGLIFEIFHLTMVFFTHPYEATEAMLVIKACSTPMLAMNSISVALSCYVHNILGKDLYHYSSDNNSISGIIQKRLAAVIVVCLIFSTSFIITMQNGNSEKRVESLLNTSINDVKNDIFNASDENLIKIAINVRKDLVRYTIEELASRYDLSEISIVDNKGIISDSTSKTFIGYDMGSGEQSAEFNVLLNGEKSEYSQKYGPISYNQAIYRKYAGVTLNGGGYIQVGYDSAHFQNDISAQVRTFVKNRHVGENGFLIVADKYLNIVSAPNTFDKTKKIDEYIKLNSDTSINKQHILDTDYYVSVDEAEGYYIVSLVDVAEIDDTNEALIVASNFIQILVYAIMFVMVFTLVRRSVLNNLNSVCDSLENISKGDLNAKIAINDSDEFTSLSSSINTTVDALKGYIDEANKRIDDELEYARSIQTSALSHTFPVSEMFEIYADSRSAKEVGGDFYDFIRINSEDFIFSIADVSGKSIPGALFMMRAKSTLRSYSERNLPMNEVFTKANERLCEGNEAGMFVTAWQGKLNLKTGEVEFANAGHNPPIIRKKDGHAEYLKGKAGFVLAGMEGIIYKLQTTNLQPGDIIYIYTDGVVEAHNLQKEMYGEQRLLDLIINAKEDESMKTICNRVYDDVKKFAGEAEQFDDITMLALKYKGFKSEE